MTIADYDATAQCNAVKIFVLLSNLLNGQDLAHACRTDLALFHSQALKPALGLHVRLAWRCLGGSLTNSYEECGLAGRDAQVRFVDQTDRNSLTRSTRHSLTMHDHGRAPDDAINVSGS